MNAPTVIPPASHLAPTGPFAMCATAAKRHEDAIAAAMLSSIRQESRRNEATQEDSPEDPHARHKDAIIARMERLRSQGRAPELTVADVAHTLRVPQHTAQRVCAALVANGALKARSINIGPAKAALYAAADWTPPRRPYDSTNRSAGTRETLLRLMADKRWWFVFDLMDVTEISSSSVKKVAKDLHAEGLLEIRHAMRPRKCGGSVRAVQYRVKS